MNPKKKATDCDHALQDSASHQYQSFAELTRRAQRNNNRLALQASRSSANAVLDRLSCSCFAVAVGTIVVVSLVSIATVLVSGEEKKLKETEKIVEKIQMNDEPVQVPKSSSMKQAVDLNDSGNNTLAEIDDVKNSMAKAESRNGIETESKMGETDGNSNPDSNQAQSDSDSKAGVDNGDDDDDVASPASKELLHAAREMNKPRKVEVGEEADIQRKILPLTPDEDRRK